MSDLLKDALEEVESGKALLVDVRERGEWDERRLKGAILAPMSRLEDGELPPQLLEDRPVYFYCRKGRRAMMAQHWLVDRLPQGVALPFSFEQLVESGFQLET